jgi:hypothetical protein
MILCDEGSKPELCSQKGLLLLGSGSVNTFPRKPNHVTAANYTHTTVEELLEAVFYVIHEETI